MDSNETYELTKQNEEYMEVSKKDVNQSESNPSIGSDSDTTNVKLQKEQTDLEKDSNLQNKNGNSICSQTNNLEIDCESDSVLQYEHNTVNNEVPVVCNLTNSSAKNNETNDNNEKFMEVIVNTSKPLCADYQSDSDSESVDSESDSSTSTDTSAESCSSSEYESDDSNNSSTVKGKAGKGGKKSKDFSLTDLPPIETLKISVPEDACVEIGKISSIVEALVIVESYKGTAALDIDTILFLDCGRQTLGKVFDILGPISEPVYAVRFNSHEQIKNLGIQKDVKVYYAPKTEHTTFVFMSEVLKNRGSDASWKDNTEAPPEFQDFSDDEEERRAKTKQSREVNGDNPNQPEQNKSRKRPFHKGKPPPGVFQGSRFRNPNFQHQRPYFPRNSSVNQFGGPPSFPPRSNFPNPPVQVPPFPYNVPHAYPSTNPLSRPPPILFPQRISAPPFPTFAGLAYVNQNQNFQQPFFQQRTHAFPQVLGGWARPSFRAPPPPPPPSDQC